MGKKDCSYKLMVELDNLDEMKKFCNKTQTFPELTQNEV